MPRFYFIVHDAAGTAGDEEGAELPNFEAAWLRAVDGARSMMSEGVRIGELDLTARIEIADENRVIVDRVSFADALSIRE